MVPAAESAAKPSTTIIYLIRHGDRHDYAYPEWKEQIVAQNFPVIDPPLSALGHQQARETAKELAGDLVNWLREDFHAEEKSRPNVDVKECKSPDLPDNKFIPWNKNAIQILASPYLRVIETATPLVHYLNLQLPGMVGLEGNKEGLPAGLQLKIEPGLAETTHVVGIPTHVPGHRFATFPYVDVLYEPMLKNSTEDFALKSTHRHMKMGTDKKTGEVRFCSTKGRQGDIKVVQPARVAEQTQKTRTSKICFSTSSGIERDQQEATFEDVDLQFPNCEDYPVDYFKRMEKVANLLREKCNPKNYYSTGSGGVPPPFAEKQSGEATTTTTTTTAKNNSPAEVDHPPKALILFSHAASVGLVGHLARKKDLAKDVGKFAPCGIFKILLTTSPAGEQTAEIVRFGGDNTKYVSENAKTTYPWLYREEALKLWKEMYPDYE
ncbi:unnamed protein product [Amoebophrya sp. A120]|nr:unnamed protein product [Amoebophrya sp. A120]|eukprot:GSA120T00007180001.1